MKKRLLLFLCIFTLLLSTAAQAEDVTAGVPAPAPSAEKADTLSPFARTRSYDGRFTDVDASAWYHDARRCAVRIRSDRGREQQRLRAGGERHHCRAGDLCRAAARA